MAGAGGVYAGGNVVVVMDPAPLVYMKVFYPGSGPDRHIRRKTQEVAAVARLLAPRRSGRLASSISAEQNRDEKGRFAFGYRVSASVYYAGYVHEGTGPSIRSKFPGAMRFPGTNRFFGQEIFTEVVQHPGTPAQPFLQNALAAMAG